jgi:hypothetical protein
MCPFVTSKWRTDAVLTSQRGANGVDDTRGVHSLFRSLPVSTVMTHDACRIYKMLFTRYLASLCERFRRQASCMVSIELIRVLDFSTHFGFNFSARPHNAINKSRRQHPAAAAQTTATYAGTITIVSKTAPKFQPGDGRPESPNAASIKFSRFTDVILIVQFTVIGALAGIYG